MSIAEICPANSNIYCEKTFVWFEHTFAILCPAEKVALEIILCSTVDLKVQNATKKSVLQLEKVVINYFFFHCTNMDPIRLWDKFHTCDVKNKKILTSTHQTLC